VVEVLVEDGVAQTEAEEVLVVELLQMEVLVLQVKQVKDLTVVAQVLTKPMVAEVVEPLKTVALVVDLDLEMVETDYHPQLQVLQLHEVVAVEQVHKEELQEQEDQEEELMDQLRLMCLEETELLTLVAVEVAEKVSLDLLETEVLEK
jgi:hypothetical protein